MNPHQAENLEKAVQTAQMLVDGIMEAYRLASESNPLLKILLRDTLRDAAELHNRLMEIQVSYQ